MRAYALILCLGYLGGISGESVAQEKGDTFTVEDVRVDVTAANATEARSQAILQGEKQALTVLLERLGETEELMNRLNDEQVGELLSGFEVQEEHTSPHRYRARLTYHFDTEAIHKLLEDMPARALPSLQQAKPLVDPDRRPSMHEFPISSVGKIKNADKRSYAAHVIELKVYFYSFDQWVQCFRNLQHLKGLEEVTLKSFTANCAELTAKSFPTTDVDELLKHMVVLLTEEALLEHPNDQTWVIRFA